MMMTKYPLLFTFFSKIEGRGYLADVAVHGRLLAEEEDGGWWAFGVNPGGVAAAGKTRTDAYIEFRKSLMQVLFDLAAQAKDFYAFRKAAMKFFGEVNKPTADEWLAAREEVRAKNITVDGLRRETSEAPRRIEIRQKKTFAAKGNITDPEEAIAA